MVLNMRLYHRRSSSIKERTSDVQLRSMTASANSRQQALNALDGRGHRSSLVSVRTIPLPPRPRSLSLVPGNDASLCVSGTPRVRSGSLSGDLGLRSSVSPALTASEEEHIFRCYVKIMYMFLAMLGAAVLGVVLYALRTSVIAPNL